MISQQDKQSQLAAVARAKLLPPNVDIRGAKATNVLINMGVLLGKKIVKPGLRSKFFDPKSGLLLIKDVLKDKSIQYLIHKVQSAELADDLHYEQTPKLLVIITTKDRIFVEHYIPGEWEQRLEKLVGDKRNGEAKLAIKRPSRTVKR